MRIHTREKPWKHCDQVFFPDYENEERYHINVDIVKRISHKKTFPDTLKDTQWVEAMNVQTL